MTKECPCAGKRALPGAEAGAGGGHGDSCARSQAGALQRASSAQSGQGGPVRPPPLQPQLLPPPSCPADPSTPAQVHHGCSRVRTPPSSHPTALGLGRRGVHLPRHAPPDSSLWWLFGHLGLLTSPWTPVPGLISRDRGRPTRALNVHFHSCQVRAVPAGANVVTEDDECSQWTRLPDARSERKSSDPHGNDGRQERQLCG